MTHARFPQVEQRVVGKGLGAKWLGRGEGTLLGNSADLCSGLPTRGPGHPPIWSPRFGKQTCSGLQDPRVPMARFTVPL